MLLGAFKCVSTCVRAHVCACGCMYMYECACVCYVYILRLIAIEAFDLNFKNSRAFDRYFDNGRNTCNRKLN